MADGTTEPKKGGSGSWWTTLPGVVTAFAGLLTAVGGLIGTLHQANILPWSRPAELQDTRHNSNKTSQQDKTNERPAPPTASAGSTSVEGVEIKILDVQRIRERNGTFVQLLMGRNYGGTIRTASSIWLPMGRRLRRYGRQLRPGIFL